jgi:hypothetical protein
VTRRLHPCMRRHSDRFKWTQHSWLMRGGFFDDGL